VARISIFFITVALIAGLAGCGEVTPPAQYELTMAIAPAGSGNATDLTNASPYAAGTVVNITAVAAVGYQFLNWAAPTGTFANANATQTTFTMPAQHVTVTACFGLKAGEIRTWYDMDAIRDNLAGSYVLMNDLDSATAGYAELAGPTANGGKGWQPIGLLFADPFSFSIVDLVDPFTGSLDGQGYEIRDLFIGRPEKDGVGLFGCVGDGVIQNLGVVIAEVTGHVYVGGLVGGNWGTVSNSYCTGSVTGDGEWFVGGLAGGNWGTVSDSYSTGSVTADGEWVGGLVGGNGGTVINSYSTCTVTGDEYVGGLAGSNWRTVSDSHSGGGVTGAGHIGGLVGWNHQGTVSNSYSTGSVTGTSSIGGLVGENHEGTVSNSYYSYDEVLINGRNIITIGGLSNEDFEQWLANDKFLDVNERLSQEDGYYLINDVNDFRSLLAFGQDRALKFRLKNDLDLGDQSDFYIPYLAGEFDGNGHRISNLSFTFDPISQVGLFGYLASGGAVTGMSAENVNITGPVIVGGLVGENDGGTVSNSYSTGSVAGPAIVGGLVGWIGRNGGTVSNSYYNYDEVLISGRHIITIGALFNEDFDQWLANDKFLDVNERLVQEDGYYLIDDVSDFKQLLAFGQDDSLKFRLKNDLDLGNEPNFYIPYLVGEFDGNGHRISSLSFNFDFVSNVGLFGYLASGAKVTRVGVENANIAGAWGVAALAGASVGAVSNSYCTGRVTGTNEVGGLVGWNIGTVSNSYSSSNVTGSWGVGGLMGLNQKGTVNNSYSTGTVTGDNPVGGLVGESYVPVSVSRSFWDIHTSGQATSAGGIGKTTAEMKNIATFTGAGWNIVTVGDPGTRNPAYTWNMVNGVTYPFLSWEP
jgi:hypothetical protein